MSLEPKTHPYVDPVRAYVEALLSHAGFDGLAPEARAEATAALMAEAQRRVGLELLTALDAKSLEYFQSLVDRGAAEDELTAFFDVRAPDAAERVRTALAAFGEECLKEA